MNDLQDGKWYWVVVPGGEPFPAKRDGTCVGGWTNDDTWEDFDNEVIAISEIETPVIDDNSHRSPGDFRMRFLVAWIFFIVGAFAIGIGQKISSDGYDKFVELIFYDMTREGIEKMMGVKYK